MPEAPGSPRDGEPPPLARRDPVAASPTASTRAHRPAIKPRGAPDSFRMGLEPAARVRSPWATCEGAPPFQMPGSPFRGAHRLIERGSLRKELREAVDPLRSQQLLGGLRGPHVGVLLDHDCQAYAPGTWPIPTPRRSGPARPWRGTPRISWTARGMDGAHRARGSDGQAGRFGIRSATRPSPQSRQPPRCDRSPELRTICSRSENRCASARTSAPVQPDSPRPSFIVV